MSMPADKYENMTLNPRIIATTFLLSIKTIVQKSIKFDCLKALFVKTFKKPR